MSALVSKLLDIRREAAVEIQRFILLWRYQHHVPPFALWWRLILKRDVDIILAALAILATSPVLLVVALAVKLDSKGPVIYAQERLGRFGEPFKILKFRTMRVDAEASGPMWSTGDQDPRMTRLGGFLRKSHLDELPQLFNVLVGHMSLVGPRPERPCFVGDLNRFVPGYDQRLLIKPGITGLAQVHYHYDQSIADVKRKLRFDLLYIRRMCLALDVRILFWTMFVVATGRGIK
jgi:lipopolysaccharide/colanic/teichoic acid biosynthesis glycosyltransferase